MMFMQTMKYNTLKSTKFKGGDCVDKDYIIEKLERELAMMETYALELEKENEALTDLVHVLQSQLNRKSASIGRSAEQYIYR